MHRSSLRNIFCWLLPAVVPASLLGANSGAAMLYVQGTAWLNGAAVPRTSAVFPGDLVQTKRGCGGSYQRHGFERGHPVRFAGEV